jgi:DNA-binding CsgD family transcriptional regulator/PAS domain-containing protein
MDDMRMSDSALMERPAAGLSAEKFGALLGAVYDCVLEPGRWPTAIDGIRAAVGAKAAWIALHFPRQVRSEYPVYVGTSASDQLRLRDEYVPMSPFIGIPHRIGAPDIISVDDAVDYDEFLAGRLFREWAEPLGIRDFIMAILAREPDKLTWLGFCLPERATGEQKALAEAFRPHVARAIAISHLLEERTQQAADLAAAVEGLGTGVIMIGHDLTVTGINPAAERLLAAQGSIAVAHGRLLPPRGPAGTELTAAVAACAEGRLERAGASILFEDRRGGTLGLMAHVIPLERPRANVPKQAVAAMFLTNPSAPIAPSPLQLFVKHYELTPSEARVLIALTEGKSPAAIAAAQGVGLPTVRTHLSRLYDKTGTAGQADVVRLVAAFARAA